MSVMREHINLIKMT